MTKCTRGANASRDAPIKKNKYPSVFKCPPHPSNTPPTQLCTTELRDDEVIVGETQRTEKLQFLRWSVGGETPLNRPPKVNSIIRHQCWWSSISRLALISIRPRPRTGSRKRLISLYDPPRIVVVIPSGFFIWFFSEWVTKVQHRFYYVDVGDDFRATGTERSMNGFEPPAPPGQLTFI